MLDLEVLPDKFIDDLKSRGHSIEAIATMSPETAFSEFCNWNGLINWGDTLWSAVQEFKDADTLPPE